MTRETPSERQKITESRGTFPILCRLPLRFLTTHNLAVGCCLAALYLLLMAAVSLKYHVIGDYGVETDFYVFVSQAKQIWHGELPIDGARGPAYIILLALVGRVVGDYFLAGMLIGLLSAGLMIFFTYRLLSVLFRPDIALLATLMMAGNRTYAQYTYSSGTDMFFAAISVAAIYYYLKQERFRYRHLIVPASLSAVSHLTRYNGTVLSQRWQIRRSQPTEGL